jgi:hypothetical protein
MCIPRITIPLTPYMPPKGGKPVETKRIRPQDALDLRGFIEELKPSIIKTCSIDQKSWSVISVYSPYGPDIHVMVMETSPDRYLPGPEWVPDAEGDLLMDVWCSIIDYIGQREENETIHVGYNWSPRSWGEPEEQTGFQSIPTKWHAMMWGWPAFPPKNEGNEYFSWIDPSVLSPAVRRLLCENTYAEPLADLIRQRLEQSFPEGSRFVELFPPWEWKADSRGIHVKFNNPIKHVLSTPNFFSQVLKPLAVLMDDILRELTEAMTRLQCRAIDDILIKTEQGPLHEDDLKVLRRAPDLRPLDEIKHTFQKQGYPDKLLTSLMEPVRNRCKEAGNPDDWWRKGFGYALVFSGPSKGAGGELRIMPGVFVGPGGVVEAEGVVLCRPEDRRMKTRNIKKKSRILWELANTLNDQCPE